MKNLNILLLGSGGRECAIAWKLASSPRCEHLYIAPGNPGTVAYGTNLPVKPMDFEAVERAVRDNNVDIVVVGNEDPLVGGIYDVLTAKGITVFGPSRAAAALEGSKDFAKEFMARHSIPTAAHLTVTADTVAEGDRFLASLQAP